MTIVWLDNPPQINGTFAFAEQGSKPLYKNPCLTYLGQEANQFVDGLDNKTKATPSRFFIKETQETDEVRLYLNKCPNGTIQNVRQSRCEVRPGVDLKSICTQPNPLTRKSPVEILSIHLKNLQRGQRNAV